MMVSPRLARFAVLALAGCNKTSPAPEASDAAAPTYAIASAAPQPAPSEEPPSLHLEDFGGTGHRDVMVDSGLRPDAGSRVTMREGSTDVSGRLPVEVVQRVLRRQFAVFRACYEDTLADASLLAGAVRVRFAISTGGQVPVSADDGSDAGLMRVSSCIRHAIEALVFPAPESGIVNVHYRLVFSPPD